METVHLTLHDGSHIINETIRKDMNLLEALNHIADLTMNPSLTLDAPCGGKGTCGKCRVRVVKGDVSPLTPEEKKLLDPNEISRGIRLACRTWAEGPLELAFENPMNSGNIQTEGKIYNGPLNPILTKTVIRAGISCLEDQKPDEQRVLDALPAGRFINDHRIRKLIPAVLRKNEVLTVSCCGDEITNIEPGDSSDKLFALAVDIGTTTVVAYLLNLNTGDIVTTVSGLNRQKSYGGDVISRIDYIGDDTDKLKKLQDRILKQIEYLLTEALMNADLEKSDIQGIFMAGNTTMMHILSGLNPQHLAVSPFIPVSTERMILSSADIGSVLPEQIRFILLPSLSAYIGADIIAGILSTGMSVSEEVSLLVDIGTNGEIALGNRDRIITCSTAAGPAFEGANIQCGTGGIPGAISKVTGDDGVIEWETIQDKPAAGICGSGIIDMTAYLLRTGIADYTGRFQDESDWGENPPENLGFLEESSEGGRFIITRDNSEVFFSQKDLREVQLAKGSIAAGIKILIQESGYSMDQIKYVFLAGGFGSFINKKSALEIGLLPQELGDRILTVGNSCGSGVIRAALNRDDIESCDRIRETAEYLELSSHKGFQDEYITNMYFPETVLCLE